MKTSEQIKGAIRNISKKTGVNPNSLLQMCLFEGILEKLSKSKYSENFILKGGLLISSLIGVDMRSTMDMDTTIRGIPLNEKSITKILNEILAIKIDTDIEYNLIKLSPIRQEDVYEDFCVSPNKLKIDKKEADPGVLPHKFFRKCPYTYCACYIRMN